MASWKAWLLRSSPSASFAFSAHAGLPERRLQGQQVVGGGTFSRKADGQHFQGEADVEELLDVLARQSGHHDTASRFLGDEALALEQAQSISDRDPGDAEALGKDLASAALAADLDADTLIMLTDGDYVSENWGTPEQRDILTASPEAMAELEFEEGSMRPKVDAAIRVAKAGGRALIGPLDRLDDVLARRVGTEIRSDVAEGIVFVKG